MSEPEIRPDPALAAADGYKFDLTGGHPALDFANTTSRRENPAESREYLTNYGRLVTWGLQTELLSPADAERLRGEASEHPRAAVAALRRATSVREAIYAVFMPAARGERVSPAAIGALNALLPEALGALRLEPQRHGFRWGFSHEESDLAPMLAPVLRSVAELLTSEDLDRVRECDAGTCFWLFLDTSKNGTRRWCDMKVCGNREKARRHHERVKKSAAKRTR
jgi:predicted RNA-binding Zn ribbon-like protein